MILNKKKIESGDLAPPSLSTEPRTVDFNLVFKHPAVMHGPRILSQSYSNYGNSARGNRILEEGGTR